MKYYLVKNDIIKENVVAGVVIGRTTDEPIWLQELIKTWKTKHGKGGRFIATADALQSLILSPEDIDHKDAEEITKKQAQDLIDVRIPEKIVEEQINQADKIVFEKYKIDEKTYKLESTKTVVIPSPKIADVEKKFLGFAMNHTGTISSNETWTLADSPHHLTGNTTVLANNTLTIEAGCDVVADGNYSLAVSGVLVSNGTHSSLITYSSGVAKPTYNSWVGIVLTNSQENTSLTYGIIKHASVGIGGSGLSLVSNMHIYNCDIGILNYYTTVYNTLVETCNTCARIDGSSKVSTLVDCELTNARISCISVSAATGQLFVLTDTYLGAGQYQQINARAGTTFTRVVANGWGLYEWYLSYVAGVVDDYTNCLFCIGNGNATRGIANNAAALYKFTNCDIIGRNMAAPLVNTSGDTRIDNCYIAGWATAGRDTPDLSAGDSGGAFNFSSTESPQQFTLVNYVANARSTRNFTFIPSSIAESSLGDNGVTISWTGTTLKTRHRVRYGTTSGVYTMCNSTGDSWSSWDDQPIMTVDASIVLTNLKSGTKYYYVCESYDWATDTWITSTEDDFTTTIKVLIQRLDINNG